MLFRSIGATAGSVVPVVGTAAGAGIGAAVGFIAGSLGNIFAGENEGDIAKKTAKAVSKADKGFDDLLTMAALPEDTSKNIRSQWEIAKSEVRNMVDENGDAVSSKDKAVMLAKVEQFFTGGISDAISQNRAMDMSNKQADIASERATKSDVAKSLALQEQISQLMGPTQQAANVSSEALARQMESTGQKIGRASCRERVSSPV